MNNPNMSSKWIRVNWEHPCPVCGKRDWCLVAADGSAAICPRVESKRDLGEAGFLHVLTESRRTPYFAPRDRRIVRDMTEIAEKCRRTISSGGLQAISERLSLPVASLKAFGIGWDRDRRAWTFPSFNPLVGKVTGIQLRSVGGDKFSVKGSRFALYMPHPLPDDNMLLVLEGASDPIAAHATGFPMCVGRHNCAGGEGYVVRVVEEKKPKEVVIVADNDEPNQWGRRVGLDGAEKLAKTLKYHVRTVRVAAPPEEFKDFRSWASSGVTRADIEREWR